MSCTQTFAYIYTTWDARMIRDLWRHCVNAPTSPWDVTQRQRCCGMWHAHAGQATVARHRVHMWTRPGGSKLPVVHTTRVNDTACTPSLDVGGGQLAVQLCRCVQCPPHCGKFACRHPRSVGLHLPMHMGSDGAVHGTPIATTHARTCSTGRATGVVTRDGFTDWSGVGEW